MTRWRQMARRIARWRARGDSFALRHLGSRSRAINEAEIRRLCRSAYLGDHEALVRVLGRYKMFVDTRDTDICAHLLLDGFWEMWVTELLPKLVRPGMVCVDVGAHVGYFTMLMADLAGEAGKVHAFEPNPHLRRKLDASARTNGFAERVQTYDMPLSDTVRREVELVIPDRQPGGGHLVAADSTGTGMGRVLLHTARLDCIDGIDQVDFIKIDAETSEQAIWHGMSGLLVQRKPMTVLMEFTPVRYADPSAFLTAMLGEGFALHRIDPNEGMRSVRSADILAEPASCDQMLVLIR